MDPRIPIHIKTEKLPPNSTRLVVVPDFQEDDHKKGRKLMFVLITVFIGISVAFSVIEVSAKAAKTAIAYMNGSSTRDSALASGGALKSDPQNSDGNVASWAGAGAEAGAEGFKNLGSDDADQAVPEDKLLPEKDSGGKYYFLSSNYNLPRTSAISYVAADLDTGEIIIEKNSDMVFPIASVSKLVTAIISRKVFDPHKQVTVSKSSVATYGKTGGLSSGEKILAGDLLYPLLMESSNDAAEVLAEGYGRRDFISKMNAFVKGLGMDATFFEDPSGLSHQNVSSARDLLKVADYIYKKEPEIFDITRVRQFAILKHSWTNSNAQLKKASFLGGKNGYTEEALRTTLSAFEIPFQGQKRHVIIVVLKSNDRDGDVDLIIRFLQKQIGFAPAAPVVSVQ